MTTTDQTKRKVPLIAKIAVKESFITRDQLKHAIRIQDDEQNEGRASSLPEIFAKTGMITPEKMLELHTLVQQYKERPPADTPPESDTSPRPDHQPSDGLDEGEFRIIISGDKMMARLEWPTGKRAPVPVERLLAKAKEMGIVHGLAREASLKSGLLNPDPNHPLVIARGTPPDPGKPPRVEYLFDPGHHRVNPKNVDSSKALPVSEPPQVQDGDLLAEKTPMIPPDSGVDIFGTAIPAAAIDDLVLRNGKGSEVFEDRLKIFATTTGVPFLSVEGTVSVFAQAAFDTDYGVSSGPVDRDSCIRTKGTLTGEYPVSGGNMEAKEIRNARMDIIGGVRTQMGITNSIIKSQGDIRASYIRGCRIETYGSVFVENEIMDSTILASGICVCEKSKIIASTIAATGGVKALGIGTQTSVPCDITVGAKTHIRNVLATLDQRMGKNEEWIKKMSETASNLAEETKHVQQQIVPLMTFHQKAEQAIQVTQARIEDLRKKQKRKRPLVEEKTLNELKTKDQSALMSLRTWSERLKNLQHEASGIPEEIKNRKEENARLLLDRRAIEAWAETIPVSARLEVRGTLCADTLVSGNNARLVIEKKLDGIQAKETSQIGPDGEEWGFSFSKNS